jgi:hypothetical protein
VRDGSGQWSNVRSTKITMTSSLSIAVSAGPTTGQPLTLGADWAHPIALPAGAMCLWEFMWGNDQSLYHDERDETFGYVMTQGPASKGFCDSWTFTLPWTPVRRYLVALRVMRSDWTTLGEAMIGGSPSDASFASSVGSTSRHITSSNLPMFYVLPDSYELRVGQPAVYRGYARGGATIRSSDRWVIQYVNTPETHPGSAVLTFYPKRTGHITVCLSREYSAGTQMMACFDPPVRAGSRSGGSGGGSGGSASGSGGSGPPAAPPSQTTPVEASAPPTASLPAATGSAEPSASMEPPLTPGFVAAAVGSAPPATPAGPGSSVSDQPAGVPPTGWIGLAALGLGLAFGSAMARPGLRLRISRAVGSGLRRWRGR